ncbi:PREDICTED: LOW QUALITY PROTEIN: solute carrier family 35 member B1-like [Priapulus caudatus]|uniref:LOW QUALITY PROTEIN: solute carrier family 35 member B1-like n=1 Tax=Priapulus caudatus TaxID=37621 RepID=A0ABM1FA55_PRICU|nr:PREDICTED: LOW QUALITY PROTEIN: solute carrier family 35 member B1-like [Priapulus caudatus]
MNDSERPLDTSNTIVDISSPITEVREDVHDTQRVAMASTSRKKLVICFVGIFCCYFYYGIVQETITRGKYVVGDTTEKFTYTLCLVFMQCVINGLFSKLIIRVTNPGTDSTPTSLFAMCSVSYLGAMLASNLALQHVNYPTQVLGKSCKPIPVMLLGVLIGGKRYNLQKYVFVTMIVIGVALFMYKDGKVSSSSDLVVGAGEALLVVSLTLDGVTGAMQDRMRGYHSTKGHHMMLNINLWSTLYLAFAVVLTGELFAFIPFAQRHPHVLLNMLLFGVTSALGQYFIFLTVADFGPLPCSIITTTRKFFTILASVLLFGNAVTSRQWTGTALVFSGLLLDSLYGKSSTVKGK